MTKSHRQSSYQIVAFAISVSLPIADCNVSQGPSCNRAVYSSVVSGVVLGGSVLHSSVASYESTPRSGAAIVAHAPPLLLSKLASAPALKITVSATPGFGLDVPPPHIAVILSRFSQEDQVNSIARSA